MFRWPSPNPRGWGGTSKGRFLPPSVSFTFRWGWNFFISVSFSFGSDEEEGGDDGPFFKTGQLVLSKESHFPSFQKMFKKDSPHNQGKKLILHFPLSLGCVDDLKLECSIIFCRFQFDVSQSFYTSVFLIFSPCDFFFHTQEVVIFSIEQEMKEEDIRLFLLRFPDRKE